MPSGGLNSVAGMVREDGDEHLWWVFFEGKRFEGWGSDGLGIVILGEVILPLE